MGDTKLMAGRLLRWECRRHMVGQSAAFSLLSCMRRGLQRSGGGPPSSRTLSPTVADSNGEREFLSLQIWADPDYPTPDGKQCFARTTVTGRRQIATSPLVGSECA